MPLARDSVNILYQLCEFNAPGYALPSNSYASFYAALKWMKDNI